MDRLSIAVKGHQLWRERLREAEPEIDFQTLADTLEGLTDVKEIIVAVARGALEDEALLTALRLRIRDMQSRASALEERAGRRRTIVRDAMVDAEIGTIRVADFGLSLRPGTPSVSVVNEAEIPPAFWEAPEPRLNRAALLQELRRGVIVPGVALSAPEPVLMMRVR